MCYTAFTKALCVWGGMGDLYFPDQFKIKNNLCPFIFRNMFRMNPDPKFRKTTFKLNVNSEYHGKGSECWVGPVVWDSIHLNLL